jgi:hypothetical protein
MIYYIYNISYIIYYTLYIIYYTLYIIYLYILYHTQVAHRTDTAKRCFLIALQNQGL